MHKTLLVTFILITLLLPALCSAADTNQVAAGTNTNTVLNPSDPELQAAAKDVMRKVVVFGVFALIGAVLVAGFALYGAYRKFGVRGLIVVGIIIAFGVVVLGSLLLLF
jgi:hypothetical protein